MNKLFKHIGCFLIISLMLSCFDPSKPNYQYFPNMYESVGYGTYDESDECVLYPYDSDESDSDECESELECESS